MSASCSALKRFLYFGCASPRRKRSAPRRRRRLIFPGTNVFAGEARAVSARCKTSRIWCSSAAALSDALSSFMTVWNPDAPASAPGFTYLLTLCLRRRRRVMRRRRRRYRTRRGRLRIRLRLLAARGDLPALGLLHLWQQFLVLRISHELRSERVRLRCDEREAFPAHQIRSLDPLEKRMKLGLDQGPPSDVALKLQNVLRRLTDRLRHRAGRADHADRC